MELEDEDREEEVDEDEDEDEDDDDEEDNQETVTLLTPTFKTSDSNHHSSMCRYRECLKNHAVTIGGHAVDGCCEFMPAGPDGTLRSLNCAACNCHRNFHRKEPLLMHPTTPNHHQLNVYIPRPNQSYHPPPRNPNPYPFYPNNGTTAPTRPLALPSPVGTRKRHRTKFSQEEKDKMLELAERLGWRIQKQDESVVQHFCDECGIKRHVLKVWMHNNKNTLGSKPLPPCLPLPAPQALS